MPTVGGMYSVKPLYKPVDVRDLPSCMYPMKNMHFDDCHIGDSGDSSDNDALLAARAEGLLERQNRIITELEKLKVELESMNTAQPKSTNTQKMDISIPREIVITCNPAFCSLAVLSLAKRLSESCNALSVTFKHSSCRNEPVMNSAEWGFKPLPGGVTRSNRTVITWIWKDCNECELIVSPLKHTAVQGEAVVCKYLEKLLGSNYDPLTSCLIDEWLDSSSDFNREIGRNEMYAGLAKRLAKNQWLVGSSKSLADIVVSSALCRSKGKWSDDTNVQAWTKRVWDC